MAVYVTVSLLVFLSSQPIVTSTAKPCTAGDLRNKTYTCDDDVQCKCGITYLPRSSHCDSSSLPNFRERLLFCHRTPQCSSENIGNWTSECNNGVRHRYFYWTINCVENSTLAVLPPPLKLPCYCPAGMGLDVNNTCQPCSPGTFNPSGDVVDDWSGWNSTGRAGEHLGFVTRCEMGYGKYSSKNCSPWKEGGNGAYLTSGKQPKSIKAASILVLDREFTNKTNSAVSFWFRVDGAMCFGQTCDGLEFYIDDALVMPLVNRQIMWKEVKNTVTLGSHRLMWIFYKQSISNELSSEQMAYIKSITLDGTASMDINCYPCPAGKFSSVARADTCDVCPAFSYQNEANQSECRKCQADTASLAGAKKCIPQSYCTSNDIVMTIDSVSKCQPSDGGGSGMSHKGNSALIRKVTSAYLKPFNMSESLCIDPSKRKFLIVRKNYTCSCQPGKMLFTSGTGKTHCKKCQSGYASTNGTECMKCLAGTTAIPGRFFYEWTADTLDEFHSACVGYGDGNGWIPSGDYVRTEVGITDSYLTLKNIVITAPKGGAIEFSCSVKCSLSKGSRGSKASNIASVRDCYLYFEMANTSEVQGQLCGGPGLSSQWDGRDGVRNGTVQTHKHILKPGTYSFRWKYHQQDDLEKNVNYVARLFSISIVGVANGSAQNCTPCPAGYNSSDGASKCSPCPAGYNSSDGASKCTPCPAGYSSSVGAAKCSPCPAGSSSSDGSSKCTPCPAGYYSSDRASECAICPPGQFSVGGTGSCIYCQGNSYANIAGSAECKKCGSSTTVNSNHTGCDVAGCSVEFRLERSTETVVYDLSHLQRFNGSMIKAKTDSSSYNYFLNLCTTVHDESSCAVDGKPVATMACQQEECQKTNKQDCLAQSSLGDTIGFQTASDIYSGLVVELTYGMSCSGGVVSTTVHMICDQDVGIGQPQPFGKNKSIKAGECKYEFEWHSTYACPVCRTEYFSVVYGECKEGRKQQQFSKILPCWGGDQPQNGTTNCTSVQCPSSSSSNSSAAVGVGVTLTMIIIILVAVMIYVFYQKHRNPRKYLPYGKISPMERLRIVDDTDDDSNHFAVHGDVDTNKDNPFANDI